MMNPKALEALRKARELFAEKADDIPSDAKAVEPIRKPRVVLIPPTDAPKFTKETMKQEHKAEGVARVMQENNMTQPKVVDAYAKLSTRKACEVCIAKGIKKPSAIAKETGKNVNQIYTALWHIKKAKRKAKLMAKPKSLDIATKARAEALKPRANWEAPSWESPNDDYDAFGVNTKNSFNTPSDDWDREPTPFEDAHMVVLHDREWYEKEIEKLTEANSNLLIQIQELKTIIKYLEGKAK